MDGTSRDLKLGGWLLRPATQEEALSTYPIIIEKMIMGYVSPHILSDASGLSPVEVTVLDKPIYIPVIDYRKILQIVLLLSNSPNKGNSQLLLQIRAEIKRRF